MPLYVALGDSYAAGIGSTAPGTLLRNRGGYPWSVASRLGLDLAYQAVFGATTHIVRDWQLGPLGADTQVVTLTVGGNDAEFNEVLSACAAPAWMTNGLAILEEHRTMVQAVLPGRMDELYAAIRDRAPRARIIAVGYPRLFGRTDCNPLTFFSRAEMASLNDAANGLNQLLADAARRNGAVWIDVRRPFAGHGICTAEPWIHSLTWPVLYSFHPNDLGHAAYVPRVLAAVAHATGRTPALRPASVGTQAARTAYGPEPDGIAGGFELRELAGESSLAGAQTYGLDPAYLVSLAQRLPRQNQRSIAAPITSERRAFAVAELARLDQQVRRLRAQLARRGPAPDEQPLTGDSPANLS